MNMMEDDVDELRFVCKLCDKGYPSGKSLGGHMRSHVIAVAAANSSESDEKFATLLINGNGNGSANENGNPSSYGLRENPKKTWRAVGSTNFPFPNERYCKQCGKGFQSLKALCGHMACHSEKDRNLKDCDHSWTSDQNLDHDDEKVVTDSYSDTEEPEFEDPTRVTRSKSKRYKKVVVKPYSFNFTLNNTNVSNDSNCNYYRSSEIGEFEQEEVAMCLMMLSKDSTNWGGVNSVVESSDNNSAVETKSSSIEMKLSKKCSSVLDGDSFQFENSNSGYYKKSANYGTKNVESDISVEEMLRNGGDRNKSKGSRELTYEEKLEIRRNLFREFGYRDPLRKRIRGDDDDSYSPELEREETNKKRNKYECLTCNKIFSSFQGLGGHRPCNKRNIALGPPKNDSGENSLEAGEFRKPKYSKNIRAKKSKGHECPICFRMFKSGQALGGHKRSHFLNGSIDRFAAIEREAPSSSDMIDLNLPAPEED